LNHIWKKQVFNANIEFHSLFWLILVKKSSDLYRMRIKGPTTLPCDCS
jgi:hypothetical protein